MKKLLIGLCITLCASPAFAALPADPKTDDTPDDSGMSCPNLTQTLRRGMRDAQTNPTGQVTELQNFLEDYFNLDEGTLSIGTFGRKTQQYLIQFQQNNGLPAYGVAGTLTRAKIAEVCKNGPTQPTEPVSCPIYNRPICGYGETLITEKDSRGCTAPRCVKSDKPVACTMEYAPVCGKPKCNQWGIEDQRGTVNGNGAAQDRMLAACEQERTYSNKCVMNAEGATYVHSGECSRGIECPVYSRPFCKDGEVLVGGERLSNGCQGAPRCVPKEIQCPMIAVDCAYGYHTEAQQGVSSNGCKLPPRCVPDTTTKKCGVNTFSVRGAQCGASGSGATTNGNGAAAAMAMMIYQPEAAYPGAYFQCYDGYSETMGGDTSCKPVSTWQKYAQDKCANHCAVAVPAQQSTGSGLGGVSTSPVSSPYEAFMWVVGELKKF